jgi:hypothetical protein
MIGFEKIGTRVSTTKPIKFNPEDYTKGPVTMPKGTEGRIYKLYGIGMGIVIYDVHFGDKYGRRSCYQKELRLK